MVLSDFQFVVVVFEYVEILCGFKYSDGVCFDDIFYDFGELQ